MELLIMILRDLTTLIDIIALLLMAYVVFAFIATRGEPADWEEYALQASMALFVGGCVGCAFLLARSGGPPDFEDLLLHLAAALTLGIGYSQLFGWRRHLAMIQDWLNQRSIALANSPNSIAAWWRHGVFCFARRVERARRERGP